MDTNTGLRLQVKMYRNCYFDIADNTTIADCAWSRFRHCNAYVTNDIYQRDDFPCYYSLVRSYDTIVAIADHSRKAFIRLGKWSRTTSKQCTQIHNALYSDYVDIQF